MSSILKTGGAVLSLLLFGIMATPISHAQSGPFASILQLNSGGSFLGIQMDDVTSANMSKFKLTGEKGVIVQSVGKGTPAEKAGLQEADVILEYGGFQVWSSTQFSRLVQETPPGRKVDLAVSRDGKPIHLTAEIGKRDEGRADNDFPPLFRPFPDLRSERRNGGVLVAPAGKPRLGLTLQPLSDQLAEHLGVPGKKGALVSSVAEGSPSAGKIRAGDIITAADGKEIREPEDLTQIVQNKGAGKMALKIIRDKKELAVEVSLPDPPSTGGEGRGLKL